ncbi:MAG: hypothetical protein HGB14_12330, partial [Anaerolineaceae bacterium]|nr:hypothetical protein [Anaerolineaceae bacterium]
MMGSIQETQTRNTGLAGDVFMTSQDFVKFALQISIMLGFALAFGQIMRRMKQPVVLGEMIGGIILGPTIFGLLFPGVFEWL